MQAIKLTGKTQKGKNRVRELGSDWEIVAGPAPVICLQNKPGLLIQPKNNSVKARWIFAENDPDFSWTISQGEV